MIGSLLILGFTLSLDNFRTAIALGGLRLSLRRSVQVALVFGLCDGLAPLVGILIGLYWSEAIGSTGEYLGAIGLGLYGLYLIIRAWRTDAPEELDRPWAVFGLIIPLSADNVLAGTSLGLLGFSPWIAAPVFGAITAVMALIGLQLGRAAAGFIRIRSDLLTGVALVVMATVLGPHA
ncbi:MAG: manganese efflux pump MntP family protein [Solirubrobacteraceae bacterium]